MKQNLLDLTNEVLLAIDTDPVDTIDDTEDSESVAKLIKRSYFDMISRRNWSHLRGLVRLESSTESSRPTHMSIKEDFSEMGTVYYDTREVNDGDRRRYTEIHYLQPDDFLHRTNNRDNTRDEFDIVIDYSGVELIIQNDTKPQYYTSFDDKNLVFDAYDKEVDTTLQSSKCQVWAYRIPKWRHVGDFIPDLPEEAFSNLLEESISLAAFELKQYVDEKAETRSQKGARWLSRKEWTVQGGIQYPNYGRKSRRYGRSPLDKTQVVKQGDN